ncbi:MAG: histidinol-phosphate transaminase [Deltaproteobacteria bacterium]|nr:histidinol-phosphate transaminase [Deltaproteobacteria bacterium]
MDVTEFFVPWYDRIKPYKTDNITMAWQNQELHRMFVNENPLGPSEKVVQAVTDAARLGNRYPDNGVRIRKRIAEIHKVNPDNVYIGNGSSEIIELMCRLFLAPGDEILLPNPIFSLYEIRALNVGANVITVDVTPDMQYDTDGMLAAMTPKTKLMVLCNPNNPTGAFIPDEDIRRLLGAGIPTLLDEAYLEYHPDHESKDYLIREYPNTVVSHTFSKAYGMAGIRFGYALADEKIIQAFRKIQIPWNTSLLSIAAAEAALDDREGLNRKIEFNNAQIRYIYDELSKIRGLKPYFSYGNYIIVDATDLGVDGQEVVDYLFEKKKIMIKAVSTLKDRPGLFRISLGTAEENRACMEGIASFFAARTR